MTRLDWLLDAFSVETDDCVLAPCAATERYFQVSLGGRPRQATHVVLELDDRPQPFVGAEARHLCGNSHCCNKRHLDWGTHSENELDKRVHGTRDNRFGERNYNAKLTAADVRLIRDGRLSTHQLVRLLGVNRRTVTRIRSRERWAHLP